MSDIIISAENIGKRYVLNHQIGGGYRKFSDTIVDTLKAPLRLLKRRDSSAVPSVSQEDFWALKDVSFEIKRGEVIGIIGRNGAGKSTLLKILSRITEPTKGRITLGGRVASLLEVGTGFHPELTGRENIFLNGAILGMRRDEIKAKFDEIVAFAEIEKFLDTPVKRYSSGMYVRLAFAVAAHLEPEILIVDEVLAVGDAHFQKKCLGRMSEVAKSGRTILVVSHNMGLIKSITDKCIALKAGSICDEGPTSEVTNRYFQNTAANLDAYIDLSNLESVYGEKRLDILGIQWLTELPLRHGEPFGFALHYRCNTLSREVSLGLGFDSLDGTRLLTFDTDYSDLPRFNIERGEEGVVEFNCESLPLAPDIYDIAIGARSGDSFPLYYRNSVVQMETTAGLETPTHIMIKGGGVRIPCKVRINKNT